MQTELLDYIIRTNNKKRHGKLPCLLKSPKNYILEMRVKRAAELLENTDLPMQKVGEEVGFSDQNYFSRIFKKYKGRTPSSYRR